MFLFLSIYFGSYFRQIHRSPHLSIEIIDLDSLASPFGQVAHPAILGPAVQAQVQSQRAGELPTLGYYLADSATLQNFRLETGGQGVDAFEYGMRKVDNQDVWGVMIVNANATSGVWAAITSGAQWTRKFCSFFPFPSAFITIQYGLLEGGQETDYQRVEPSHSSFPKRAISTLQSNTSSA
jgi:hypothetical protein